MAVAVTILSPVTIITLTPASWHLLTASSTPSLKESLIPKTPRNTKSYWSINLPSSFALSELIYSSFDKSLYAIYKLLNRSLLKFSIVCSMNFFLSLSIGFTSPVTGSIYLLQNLEEFSPPPFEKRR